MSKSVQQEQAGRATSKQLDLSYVVVRDATQYVQSSSAIPVVIPNLPLYTLLYSKDSAKLPPVGVTRCCATLQQGT